jgi:drug/metabolite transporter (DMT)-like permease
MTSDTRTIGAAGWAVYAGVCLIFGTTFLAIKLGTNAGIPPFLGAGFAGAVLLVGIATGYSDLAPLGALATGQTSFPLTAPAVGSLLYLIVFGSIGGHSMYLWLVGNTGPIFASTWLYVSPIIATVVGAAVLSEQVLISNIAGAALVIFGVYIINRAERGG